MQDGAVDQRRPYPPGATRGPVGVWDTIALTYRVVIGQLRSPGRIIALLLLSLTAPISGFAVGSSSSVDLEDAVRLVANLGFAVIIPVVCLVFAGGALGDLREDKTLVYLWLRPMRRWPIVVGAALAAMSIAAPVSIPTVVVGAVATRAGSGLVGATMLAAAVGVVAYTAVFLAMGVWLRRHIVWGLAYILIWEGFIALGGRGVAQFAIRSYTRSIITKRTGIDLDAADFSAGAGVIVPLAIAVAMLALASWRLAHHDVD